MNQPITVDGNEAAARIAYLASEVVAIYPITPASPMGEHCDAWAARARPNAWGDVPSVVEMQSEGGAAGSVHGALQGGSLTTTFTASQGLLLMMPNMFKIAGELTPAVFHVAARSVATHALSIFGDHSDVMAVRSSGFAQLCSASPEECQDLALIAHAATLRARVPFIHFFDGFRTSHEIGRITPLDAEDVRALIDPATIAAHRERGLSPDRPVLRGTAQNPDVFFQAREAVSPFYAACPAIVADAMAAFAERTGRRYGLFDYEGHPEAERVLVLMGSGTGAASEAVAALVDRGEKVGLVRVRLYRPFDVDAFLAALPAAVRGVTVLDRTKEPGAVGEPLYQDVVAALHQAVDEGTLAASPRVIGGRYGLSSKEFTPAMAVACLAELDRDRPRRSFTVGIVDDVSGSSIEIDRSVFAEPDDVVRAVFYGLGSDGTVGANKNTVKIIGTRTDRHAQGYFVYDSKKAGSTTVSHLRFGPRPIQSTYKIEQASFVACHQFGFLDRTDVLTIAAPGATFLLNSPWGPDEVWDQLPRPVQETIIEKKLRFFIVDGHRIAREAGLGGRINVGLQTCFFALADVLPREQAIAAIKKAVADTYGKLGEIVVERNEAAVDAALHGLHEVAVPATATSERGRRPVVPEHAPDFVKRVTATIIDGQGDLLPVSAMPVDGTFPTGTARWEKRSIAREIPIWEPELCIQCAKCAIICPHAAIRMKVFDPQARRAAPEAFKAREWLGKDFAGLETTIQVAPDDCTGCGVCVDVCPARDKSWLERKAINMAPKEEHLAAERGSFEFFLDIPELDRTLVKTDSVKGSQMLEPLFEFSGACAGCGETPYLKLATQLFGDRMLVANATGCSSIFGGNLPTTPWSSGRDGRGPAWSNSLFEDNAEFGLGMRLAVDARTATARRLVEELRSEIGGELAGAFGDEGHLDEAGLAARRASVSELRKRLEQIDDPRARALDGLADELAPKSVWIIGGDGWAYDIGFGGLDHVLASGRDVNVLVLDTEVYSNTGGQSSKATPRGAVAKFASAGKPTAKKDLGMIAMAYGNVYVAQVALGADEGHCVRALVEAESWPGPSIVIAYCPCIAHGIDMSQAAGRQRDAVASGYWPLYRYDPRRGGAGEHPFRLDGRKPTKRLREFAAQEGRFAMLARSDPKGAAELLREGQRDVDERLRYYRQLAGLERDAGELPQLSRILADESGAKETP